MILNGLDKGNFMSVNYKSYEYIPSCIIDTVRGIMCYFSNKLDNERKDQLLAFFYYLKEEIVSCCNVTDIEYLIKQLTSVNTCNK